MLYLFETQKELETEITAVVINETSLSEAINVASKVEWTSDKEVSTGIISSLFDMCMEDLNIERPSISVYEIKDSDLGVLMTFRNTDIVKGL